MRSITITICRPKSLFPKAKAAKAYSPNQNQALICSRVRLRLGPNALTYFPNPFDLDFDYFFIKID